MGFTLHLLSSHPDSRDAGSRFLNQADVGIGDFRIERVPMGESKELSKLSLEARKELLKTIPKGPKSLVYEVTTIASPIFRTIYPPNHYPPSAINRGANAPLLYQRWPGQSVKGSSLRLPLTSVPTSDLIPYLVFSSLFAELHFVTKLSKNRGKYPCHNQAILSRSFCLGQSLNKPVYTVQC